MTEKDKRMKIPCKECIVYAVCKLKQEIICNEANKYCIDNSLGYKEFDSDRIYEVIDYLGKGGATEAPSGKGICFADAFTDDGVKLN